MVRMVRRVRRVRMVRIVGLIRMVRMVRMVRRVRMVRMVRVRIPLCAHGNRSKRGSFAIFNATRYFAPSFSNSAMTQSVMQGVHLAYKQSIMPLTRSILFRMEKLMKFVSIRT